MIKNFRAFLVFVLIASFASDAIAQSSPVRAGISSGEKYLGQPFLLEIVISGEGQLLEPELPELPQFDVAKLQTNTTSRGINGRFRQTITFQYQLIARELGSLEIPPATVTVDGRQYQTQTFSVEILAPEPSPSFELQVSFEQDEIYVGQPVRLRLTILYTNSADEISISIPGLRDAFEVQNRPAFELDAYTRRGENLIEFRVEGMTAAGVSGRGSMRGERVGAYTIELLLIPKQAGRVVLGPPTLAGVEVLQRGGQIDRIFRRRAQTKPFANTAEEMGITIRSLPSDDVPTGFDGLVGSFDLRATASPREVNVGDPITLTVYVIGDEPLDRIGSLDLEENAQLMNGFRLPAESSPSQREGNALVFTQTIRAARSDVSEIPPVGIWHYDVEQEDYVFSATPPIPISVNSTRQLTLADAEGGATGEIGSALESRAGGIMHNFTTSAALVNQSFSLGQALRSPVTIAALATPVGAYSICGVAAFVRRRSRDESADARRRRALSRAITSLNANPVGGDALGHIERAMLGYVADIYGRSAVGLTPNECEALMDGVDEVARAEFIALLRRCDQLRFAGGGVDAGASLRDDAIRVLQATDPEIRRS